MATQVVSKVNGQVTGDSVVLNMEISQNLGEKSTNIHEHDNFSNNSSKNDDDEINNDNNNNEMDQNINNNNSDFDEKIPNSQSSPIQNNLNKKIVSPKIQKPRVYSYIQKSPVLKSANEDEQLSQKIKISSSNNRLIKLNQSLHKNSSSNNNKDSNNIKINSFNTIENIENLDNVAAQAVVSQYNKNHIKKNIEADLLKEKEFKINWANLALKKIGYYDDFRDLMGRIYDDNLSKEQIVAIVIDLQRNDEEINLEIPDEYPPNLQQLQQQQQQQQIYIKQKKQKIKQQQLQQYYPDKLPQKYLYSNSMYSISYAAVNNYNHFYINQLENPLQSIPSINTENQGLEDYIDYEENMGIDNEINADDVIFKSNEINSNIQSLNIQKQKKKIQQNNNNSNEEEEELGGHEENEVSDDNNNEEEFNNSSENNNQNINMINFPISIVQQDNHNRQAQQLQQINFLPVNQNTQQSQQQMQQNQAIFRANNNNNQNQINIHGGGGGLMPTMTIHSNNRQNMVNLPKFTCEICFEESTNWAEYFQMQVCKHDCCLSCINFYLKNCINTSQVLQIKCMQDGCKLQIPERVIEKIVQPDIFQKYKRFKTRLIQQRDPNMRFCIRPDCEEYTKAKGGANNLLCVCKCGMEFCARCNGPWHPQRTCEQTIDQEFQIYMKNNVVQTCPKCVSKTEKRSGCNHLTCQVCKHEWCWLCRGRYKRGHFSRTNPLGCPGFYVDKANWPIAKIYGYRCKKIIKLICKIFFYLIFGILILLIQFSLIIPKQIEVKFMKKQNIKKQNFDKKEQLNYKEVELLRDKDLKLPKYKIKRYKHPKQKVIFEGFIFWFSFLICFCFSPLIFIFMGVWKLIQIIKGGRKRAPRIPGPRIAFHDQQIRHIINLNNMEIQGDNDIPEIVIE